MFVRRSAFGVWRLLLIKTLVVIELSGPIVSRTILVIVSMMASSCAATTRAGSIAAAKIILGGRKAFTSQSHYEGIKETYATLAEYGHHMELLGKHAQERLHLNEQTKETRLLLDIGGGTGNFTREIIKDTSVRAVVVDPFLDPNSHPSETDSVQFVKATAESFKEDKEESPWWRRNYHQILMKEVVHHLDDRVAIFRGMRESLVAISGLPSLLIMTRPQLDIDYPLWEQARQVWAKNQPSLHELVDELEQAGFSNVQHSTEAYPCSIPFATWQSMIKGRFWSTFSNFTDLELEQACQLLEEAEKHRIVNGNICFEDRVLFITASK
jgi:hypothetical protein